MKISNYSYSPSAQFHSRSVLCREVIVSDSYFGLSTSIKVWRMKWNCFRFLHRDITKKVKDDMGLN